LLDSDRWGCEKRKHTVVPCWYKRPGYVTAVARLIKDEINAYSEEDRLSGKGIHVLFSAHGVPKSYIEVSSGGCSAALLHLSCMALTLLSFIRTQNGDPYQKQIQECVSLISKEYEQEGVTTHLSYQSRVGPIEWLRPYTDDTIPELGRAGVKNLVVVPISFVSEHIETLEEIDMEYRETALEAGITNWRRVPALNTDEGFLMDMADLCEEALRQPAVSISEACSANNVDLGGGDPVAEAVNNRATQQKLLGLATLSSVALDIFFGKGVSYLFGM
jgi:ferrochelatase